MPRRNQQDVEDVRRKLQFVVVDFTDKVLAATLSQVKQTEPMLIC